MHSASIIVPVGLAMALQGCGATALPPPIEDPTPLSKCQVAKSSDSPLVTEWPASEKAHIESLLARQAVVVRYADCKLRILHGCSPAGRYIFQRTSLAKDTVEITDVNDLYAKLPIGAGSLEAELEASGRLAIHTTAVGQMRLDEEVRVPRTAACQGATHVVRAMSVGAYEMSSGQAVGVGAGASLGPIGAGASHRTDKSTLRAGGDPARCALTGEAPHMDCRSPLQLFLGPVSWTPERWAAPAATDTPAMPTPVAPASATLESPEPPMPSASSPTDPLTGFGRAFGPGPARIPPAGSSKACEDVVVEVVRITPVRSSFHLRGGGSRVVLKLRNPSLTALRLPSSSGLHISSTSGDGFTARPVPDAQLWFRSEALPAGTSLRLEVIVGPGLTKPNLASVLISGVTVGSLFDRCQIRAAFASPSE